MPKVTKSLPEILTSNKDKKAPKEGLAVLDGGDVYGNGHAFAGDKMKAIKENGDLCTDWLMEMMMLVVAAC